MCAVRWNVRWRASRRELAYVRQQLGHSSIAITSDSGSAPMHLSPPEPRSPLPRFLLEDCVVAAEQASAPDLFWGPTGRGQGSRCRKVFCETGVLTIRGPATIGARRWSPCSPCTAPSDSPRVSGAWLA